ncbi:MAG TPA: SPFH domain-containing protein [Tepidisphaeraceae bacterium]|jgi:regulator of protease activity HflC (stomatin/prohibitin superfamily)|nr:SPFH domain-containing protein [Tepidisphaeraceae bacterium]
MPFGVRYLKASPTTHVFQFVNGRTKRLGPGLSFFYMPSRSVIVLVPMSSVDVPFIFNEVSSDFQDITIQGQITYRVIDPAKLVQHLDFSVHPSGRYISDDPKKVGDRLVGRTQVLASAITHRMPLRQAMVAYETLSMEVVAGLRQSPAVQDMGIEIMDLAISSLKPTPETAKALEAEARESVLREADQAVYARRNNAVELERRIKESELNTEMAVQEKNRQIREARMNADIAFEQQRRILLEQRLDNERNEADTRAYALNAVLTPIRQTDWRTLTAINSGKLDSKANIAMAFRDLAENAGKIGQLNISTELLAGLLKPDDPPSKR